MDPFAILGNPLDSAFLLSAALGGVLFILRILLGLIGIDDAGDIGAGGDFNLLSFHTVTGFFMVFGLAGLALHRGSGLGDAVALAGGAVCAILVVLLIAKLAQQMRRLETSGNLRLAELAAGHTGTVYLTIPPKGTGQVQIVIDGRLMTLDAMTREPEPIRTGERVRVTEVMDGDLLVVGRAEQASPSGSPPGS